MAGQIWTAGLVLAGRFRLEHELGRGGMGAVWRAEHLTLRSPVAIKLIDPMYAKSPEMQRRFMREAQSAAALRSQHVVQILDYGVDGDVPFIAMELLEGESLAARLAREGRLTPQKTLEILRQMARAIGRAHEAGIVHRDLKPDNVFLVREDDAELAKVLDFGIAKVQAGSVAASVSDSTRTGAILGTPYYMSPEQAQGNKVVDTRSDLWSFAVIAFECLTGRRPFVSDALGDLVLQICMRPIPVPSSVGSVPAGFDAWFARATERDPEARFQSVREALGALEPALSGVSVGAGTAPPDTRAGVPRIEPTNPALAISAYDGTRAHSRRAAWLGLGAALVVAAGAAGLFAVSRQSGTQPAMEVSGEPDAPAAPPPSPPPEASRAELIDAAAAPTASASAAPPVAAKPVPQTRRPPRTAEKPPAPKTSSNPVSAPKKPVDLGIE